VEGLFGEQDFVMRIVVEPGSGLVFQRFPFKILLTLLNTELLGLLKHETHSLNSTAPELTTRKNV